MVFNAMSVNAEGGGLGRGSAVRESVDVGPIWSSSESQMICLAKHGWCPRRSSTADFSSRTIGFAVGASVVFANVPVLTQGCFLLTFSIIP